MNASDSDRNLLRPLGEEIAEIAALPVQQETIEAWRALNGLQPARPMVMIDQIPWHEMEVNGELELQCQDPWCRDVERQLRRTLYKWRHMPGDMVVEPVLEVAKVVRNGDFGVVTQEKRAVLDPANNVVGHLYLDQLQTEDDLARIREPHAELDEEATARARETALSVFDGVLEVRMQGVLPVFAAWDRLVIGRFTDLSLSLLDQLEDRGLLGSGQALIHCTGAYTEELPGAGFDAASPRGTDLWTYGMAQIFSSVSPAMHKEFWLDYAERWFARFGLGYYGCCEPLHHKVDLIRALPNVRKISMSPFVDVELGAEAISGDFVFSRKPSPALLATDTWEPEAVERDLQTTLDACQRHGCPLELILKDISTVRYEPQRLWEWNEITARLVGAPRARAEV
jgi:hypothetical protein